jgi:predicted DCC family thiol-disulfide oxidoreductase YuxK
MMGLLIGGAINMKTYSKVVSHSLIKINHLITETEKLLEEPLTDEVHDLIIETRVKLIRMKSHCEAYLREKK